MAGRRAPAAQGMLAGAGTGGAGEGGRAVLPPAPGIARGLHPASRAKSEREVSGGMTRAQVKAISNLASKEELCLTPDKFKARKSLG